MLPGFSGENGSGTHAARRAADYHSPMRFPYRLAWLGLIASLAAAADLQPRSYSYLLSHASVVAAGKVTSVSTGFMSDGRKAVIDVDGLIKGKLTAKELEVSWNDKEFEETAYKDDARVVVFVALGKDSAWSQVAPGISCWPVEKIDLKGKQMRAVEYAYPLDLITEVPPSVLRETETVEKSMNFQVAKRKKWIMADQLLPPVKPLVLPKPRPKPAAKPASKRPATKAKPSKGKSKSLF